MRTMQTKPNKDSLGIFKILTQSEALEVKINHRVNYIKILCDVTLRETFNQSNTVQYKLFTLTASSEMVQRRKSEGGSY